MAPTSQASTPLSGGAVRNATRAWASEAPILQETSLGFLTSAQIYLEMLSREFSQHFFSCNSSMWDWFQLLKHLEVDGLLHVGLGLAARPRTAERYSYKDDGCATSSPTWMSIPEYQKQDGPLKFKRRLYFCLHLPIERESGSDDSHLSAPTGAYL